MRLEMVRKSALEADPHKPPILFIHGAYHAAWAWERYQAYFAERGYSSIAISVRGHGVSEGMATIEKATLTDYLADVEEVLSTFETPPIVIGHSLGAVLIRTLLERHTFPAAVLIGTPTRSSLLFGIMMLLRKYPLKTLQTLFTSDLQYLYGVKAVLSFLFYNKEKDATLVGEYVARNLAQKESTKFAMETIMQRIRPYTGKTPVLVLEAEYDESTNEKFMNELGRFYEATTHMIKGVPHVMMLATEWENGAEVIAEWLKKKLST